MKAGQGPDELGAYGSPVDSRDITGSCLDKGSAQG
jgi:hypothetical protein